MKTAHYWIKTNEVINIIFDELDRVNEEGTTKEYEKALNNAYNALSTLLKFW